MLAAGILPAAFLYRHPYNGRGAFVFAAVVLQVAIQQLYPAF